MADSWIRVLFLVCVFAAVVLGAELLVGFLNARRGEKKAINQRLQLIQSGVSRVETMSLLRRQTSSLQTGLPTFLASPAARIDRMLVQAGLIMPTGAC